MALTVASASSFCDGDKPKIVDDDPSLQNSLVQAEFYPLSKCLEDGYINVSDLHSIYYHVYGNPNGKPVLFVHGGPGGGTDPSVVAAFVLSAVGSHCCLF